MSKKETRTYILIAFALVVLSAFFGFLYSAMQIMPVDVVAVEQGNIEEKVEMSGDVDSEDSGTVISNAEGIIGGIAVEEGDRVKRGQILCVIRSPELRQKLLDAQAELAIAERDIASASTNLARQLARTRYNYIKANIADIEETMRPRAHIGGDVIRVDVRDGAKILPGMTMFLLADMSRPIVKARMDEDKVQKVNEGQSVIITGDFLSGKSLQGKIYKISKYVDKKNGTYVETLCKLFNPQNYTLKFGAYADIKVITGWKKNVLLIPREALIMGDIPKVFIVENGRARLLPVKIGVIGDKNVEVLSGLQKGELVVTVGNLELVDGDKVRLRQPLNTQ